MTSTKIKMLTAFAKLLNDRSGNFAIMLAVMMPVLIGAAGLALDFANGLSLRTRLTDAADAALMSGLRAAAEAKRKGDPQWHKIGDAQAKRLFTSYLTQEKLTDVTFKPTFTADGFKLGGTATYQYVEKSLVMNFLGKKRVVIGQAVHATTGNENYIDIAFLIDNSGSMGIGATRADQELMYDNIKNGSGAGCAFACHIPKNEWEAPFTPDKARALGASLRIDIVKEALDETLRTLQQRARSENIRVSVYTFSNTLQTLVPPTTDISRAISQASTLDIIKRTPGGPQNLGGSYIRTALEDVEKQLDAAGRPGDGSTKTARKSYLVMFSDGIEDSQSNVYSGGTLLGGTLDDFDQSLEILAGWKSNPAGKFFGTLQMQPFDPAGCNSMKARSRTIYTAQIMYTTTIGMRDQSWNPPFLDYIASAEGDIENAFQKCASSPSKHVVAENSAQIVPVFETIIENIISESPMRLTQ